MSLKDDLISEVKTIFKSGWTKRNGLKVPDVRDLNLGNDSVELDATVLYADMAGSTAMVDQKTAQKAAEIYKSYMLCSGKIVKDEGGAITAYDGDRIMAVFIGDSKNSDAARTALKLQWAIREIVNKEFRAYYTSESFVLRHVIGIDTSKLLVSRIGVRNDNDLVWVGRAANYAAKLSAISDDSSVVYITNSVYERLSENSKFGSPGKQNMWEKRLWTAMNKMEIYRSSWQWEI
jgi:class 3 adenylate cyclase